MTLLLFAGGTGSPAAAQVGGADGQASQCPAWVETPPGEASFSARFPVPPNHGTTKLSDGRRWQYYGAKEGDKLFTVEYRKKSSDDGKWTQVDFDDLKPSHRPGRDILWQSACLFENHLATEQLTKVGGGYYWRDLRIDTDGYFYTISLAAKTVGELESGEAQCFFDSFKLKPASP